MSRRFSVPTRWIRFLTVTVSILGKVRYLHQVVLEAFVGPCTEGMECCHNDGDPFKEQRFSHRW